jgi:3',5'-cyclic AMP phosphodiesterase CpdA
LLTFLQLTDLHLVNPGSLLYGIDPLARLEAAVSDIAARHGPDSACPAAFLVVTGDMTHDGDDAIYRALAAALARLPFPVHPMVGNHDSRALLRAAFPGLPADPQGFVQYAFDTPAGRFILLDTLAPGAAHGELCARRLAALDAELSGSSAPVFLFLHHPPLAVGLEPMDRLRLRQADALLAVLAPHRARVRHLFFGHVHRPVSGSWHGMPFSTIPALGHQLALDFSATSSFPGSLEPPGYAVVRIADDAVVVHTHGFLDRTATFNL